MPPRLTRAHFLRGLAAGLAATALPPLAATAQEATPAAVSPPITSTGLGEMPSTGARRPGPVGPGVTPLRRRQGDPPVAIQIETIGVNAQVENRQVVDGVMQDPTGPWVVSWYDNLGTPGQGRNVVMAGHIDYWNVGPSVFYHLADLQPGDTIRLTGADGNVFTYAVDWVKQVDADNAPLDQIVGATGKETLTLITCGGTFDFTNGRYLQRTVVRADRVRDPEQAGAASPAA